MIGDASTREIDQIADAASILVLSPALASESDAVCASLLDEGNASNLLWIAYGGRPSDQVDRWEMHVGRPPADCTVISVSENGSAFDSTDLPYDLDVETISNPTDLTGLGIRITEVLRRWEDDDRPTRVCFDSLTPLLQYVEFETIYEFLHVVSDRIYAMDATAHFHIDPGAHDDQTIESLATLSDAVIEITDGALDVRSR